VLDQYRHLNASSCFLGAHDLSSPVAAFPLANGDRLVSGTRVEAWVRTYVQRPRVYFVLDKKVILATDRPEAYSVVVKPEKDGPHLLEVLVYDDRSQLVSRMPIKLRTRTM
jgi:hypothetical protein